MSAPEIRSKLAEEQSALVAAVVGGGAAPEGFDADRVCMMARSLRQKRLRTVARAWPALVQALGDDEFKRAFLEYAQQHTLPPSASPSDDAMQFVRWLRKSGPLPDTVRLILPQPWPIRLFWFVVTRFSVSFCEKTR
jgi:hypothetical protein